jgi:hypothetical protein
MEALPGPFMTLCMFLFHLNVHERAATRFIARALPFAALSGGRD